MPKTFTAPFAQTPKTATAVATAAAVVTSDAPTNTVLLLTAGTEGCIVTGIQAISRDTNTAANLVLFLSNSSNTSVKRMINNRVLPAYTASATTAAPIVDFGYTEDAPLRLGAGDQIYVASQVAAANGIVFTAEYTDF